MRESRVEGAFVREVERAGGRALKLVTPGRRHAPDRIVLWPHRQITDGMYSPARVHFVELKAPGKKPRPGQRREHERLERDGFEVFVLDTIPKVKSYIRRHA